METFKDKLNLRITIFYRPETAFKVLLYILMFITNNKSALNIIIYYNLIAKTRRTITIYNIHRVHCTYYLAPTHAEACGN
jgi:hypothetical protein